MKAIFKKKDILKAMSALLPATDKRASITILGMVKIEPKKDCLILTATDFNIRMRYKVPAKVESPEQFCLNAEHLARMTKAVQGDMVELSFSGSGRARISGGNVGFGIGVMLANDFPTTNPKIKESVTVSSTALLDVLHKTSFASANDMSRYYVGGMYLDSGDAVSTDGSRLSLVKAPWAKDIKKTLIVADALRIATSSIPAGCDVKIGYSETEIELATEFLRFSYKRISKEFPAYKSIIPKDDDFVASFAVSSEQLKNAMAGVTAISGKDSNVSIVIEDGKAGLSASGEQSDVFVKLEGKPLGSESCAATVPAAHLRDLTIKAKGDIILRIPKDITTPFVADIGKDWKYIVAQIRK